MKNLCIVHKRAQSTLEYAVLAVAIAAAVFGTGVYLKRSLAGRMKQTADSISTRHFHPDSGTWLTTSFTSIDKDITIETEAKELTDEQGNTLYADDYRTNPSIPIIGLETTTTVDKDSTYLYETQEGIE